LTSSRVKPRAALNSTSCRRDLTQARFRRDVTGRRFCIVLYRFVSLVSPGAGRITRYFRPLFSPPNLSKRRHRRLACRIVAVRRALDIAVMSRGHIQGRPWPRPHQGKRWGDNDAVLQHVVIVPSAR
jgi:hypothetical protein